ncbi:MAG: hypothetical protein FD123_3594 [Bacteroidetes bacterium]|nr:MAG: hypothetical protein FD123_3594 [Bacteroidota bacterium]
MFVVRGLTPWPPLSIFDRCAEKGDLFASKMQRGGTKT